jgi:hypothetical protein
LLSIAAAYAVQQFQVRVPATGNIMAIGLGVYGDQACTTALSSIDWGLLEPGTSKTATCFFEKHLEGECLFSPIRE